MFDNPGEKLKGIVKAVASVGMVFSVLAGVVIITMLMEVNGIAAFISGIAVGGLGFLAWWLIALVLMVVADIADNLWQVKTIMAGSCAGSVSTAGGNVQKGNGAINDRGIGNKIIMADGTVKYDSGPEWKCSACNYKNPSTLIRCYKCGKKKPE